MSVMAWRKLLDDLGAPQAVATESAVKGAACARAKIKIKSYQHNRNTKTNRVVLIEIDPTEWNSYRSSEVCPLSLGQRAAHLHGHI